MGDEGQGQEGTAGVNPAWNDVLNYVPEDKRNEVIPKLQEWDNNFQQVQSTVAPWKDFINSGIDPETAEFSVNVLSTLESNPRAVYDALGAHLGISSQEAKELVEDQGLLEEELEEPKEDPRIAKLEKQTEAMAQILLARKNEEMAAEQDAALDQEMKALRNKLGDFDEEYVLAKMYAGMDPEDAAKSYFEFEEQLRSRRPPAPKILSGGSGNIPQASIDPTKLDSKGTKDLVVQMLAAAKAQGG